ncbi:MAG: 4Fe-4S ferredoxin, partial [Chloroflexi bacterium]|nr:4Fe-4S ferredoxin [Chloroflexota bacterium]
MSHRPWLRLLSPATRAFVAEGRRLPGYSLWDGLHGYVYARWTYLYIGLASGDRPALRRLRAAAAAILRRLPRRQRSPDAPTFADAYHGKVVPLSAAAQLVTVEEDVNLGDLEQIIPYRLAREIVLQHPQRIVALDCPCRVGKTNPCLPLDVCLIVGEPFASLVREHQPTRSRWITPHEAVEILQQEDARGHVHHAFFKDAMLGRFYAICN